MDIALHDSDFTGFPNYALMKLSAYHKSQGDNVEWWIPLKRYDRVYSSKIFTFSPEDPMLPPDTIKCGTGYGNLDKLPQEIDDMMPDYSIYPSVEHSIGFITRGCIRKCPWCIVPKKEGMICPYREWQDIKRRDTECRDIVFMDNNVLAHEHGIKQMERMIGQNVRIDFNQGMDARLITPEVAEIISRLKWIRSVRMSCDTDAMLDTVLSKIDLLKQRGTNTLDCMHDQQAVVYPGVGITSKQNASNPQPGDPAPTISTDSRNYLVKENKPPRKYIVRRLTPLECCRLQGFPDWWEDGVEGSDSVRYRMWGNGMALPNMLHVMKGIVALEEREGVKR